MLLGVRGRTPSLAHHNVLFAESRYDAEFDSVFGRPGSPVAGSGHLRVRAGRFRHASTGS